MACVRILIADDHDLVRQGLRALLAARPAWEVCGEAADGVEAIEKAAELQPDIVLLDLSMPRLTGLEAVPLIRRESPASEIVIVSQHDAAEMLASALEAGARGFVSKSDIGSNLLSVIESIVQRASPPSDPERQRAESLLLEQNQLLELIARGRPLDDCLRAITESVSRLQPGVRAAVALCDCSGARLAQVVSSRLPVELTAQLCELPIGSHIAGDALWSPQLRELCIAHGVRAVHTTPVCNGEGTALASFIVCLEEAREPNAWERDLVQFGAHLGSLAIERKQAEERLRERSAQLEILVDQAPIGVF